MLEEISAGKLMDSTDAEFEDYCKNMTRGELESFRNFIAQSYSTIEKAKNKVLEEFSLAESSGLPEAVKTSSNTLTRFYLQMQNLENKAFICVARIRELQDRE